MLGWFMVGLGLFSVLYCYLGWLMVDLKSVPGWIKVHVGIQGLRYM